MRKDTQSQEAEERTTLAFTVRPSRWCAPGLAIALLSMAGCEQMEPEDTKPTTPGVEASQQALSASDGPPTGIANIMMAGSRSTPRKWVCADNEGESPLIANRDALGYWEQYYLFRNDDGSYVIQSMANKQFVGVEYYERTNVAKYPQSNTSPWHSGVQASDCQGCHGLGAPYYSFMAPARFFITNRGSNIFTVHTMLGEQNFWHTYPSANPDLNGLIKADSVSDPSYYQVLTERIPGYSANMASKTSYYWAGIYIGERWCRGPEGGGVNYTFKVSNVVAPTTLNFYLADLDQGGSGNWEKMGSIAIRANGVYTLPRTCGPSGYNMHAVYVEFTSPAILDEIGWVFRPGA